MKNSYFLVIPKQQANAQRLKEYEAHTLTAWIEALPSGNPRLTTRLLHDFIRTFNTVKMPVQQRLDTLEALRPTFFTIEDYLRGRLIKLGFPKEDNDSKILNTLVAIEREFSIGYWTVLKELTQSKVGWFQGKNTAIALQRTIKGLSGIIISHFIMGMPIPDWVWLDLHSLYKLGLKTKKETVRVDNVEQYSLRASSAQESYFQILLLSLAEPKGLMQKEVLLTYQFIENITLLLNLKATPVDNQTVQCLVLIDEDSSPYFQTSDAPKPDSVAYYLDLTRVYNAFEHRKAAMSGSEARFNAIFNLSSTEQKPSLELLDYLQQRWSGIGLQGAVLFEDRLDRYIAIGFEATYELQNLFDTSMDKDKELEFLAQSESESLLSCTFQKPDMLSVGSLISYRKTDVVQQQRFLGVINKIIVVKPVGKVLLSMQLLSEQSDSITYLRLDVSNEETLKKALFYKILDDVNYDNKSYIIIDTSILKENDIIKLFVGSSEFLAALVNRKNIGLGYWQFECLRLPDKKMLDSFNEESKVDESNFDFI